MDLKKDLCVIKSIGIPDTVIAEMVGVTTQTIRNIREGNRNVNYTTGSKVAKFAEAARAFREVAGDLLE